MDSRYLHDKEELKSSRIDEDRRKLLTAGLVGGAVAAGALVAGAAHAQQVAQAPAGAPFWPHPKWGKDDAAGASNWITPAKVLDAAKWIKDGKIYRIGRVYELGMPKFGERAFTLRIPGWPDGRSVRHQQARLSTTSSSPPRSARPARSSMAWVTSASRWARTATRTTCATTTASPGRSSAVPTA